MSETGTLNPSTPVNISTKRTGVNVAVLGYVAVVVGWATKGRVVLDLDSPIMLVAPAAVGVIVGIGYRLSRALTTKFPTLGWVLFGSGKEPVGVKAISND